MLLGLIAIVSEYDWIFSMVNTSSCSPSHTCSSLTHTNNHVADDLLTCVLHVILTFFKWVLLAYFSSEPSQLLPNFRDILIDFIRLRWKLVVWHKVVIPYEQTPTLYIPIYMYLLSSGTSCVRMSCPETCLCVQKIGKGWARNRCCWEERTAEWSCPSNTLASVCC